MGLQSRSGPAAPLADRTMKLDTGHCRAPSVVRYLLFLPALLLNGQDKKTFSKDKTNSLGLPSTLILCNLLQRARHLKEASDKNGEFMMDTLLKVRHSDVNAWENEIKKQK